MWFGHFPNPLHCNVLFEPLKFGEFGERPRYQSPAVVFGTFSIPDQGPPLENHNLSLKVAVDIKWPSNIEAVADNFLHHFCASGACHMPGATWHNII